MAVGAEGGAGGGVPLNWMGGGGGGVMGGGGMWSEEDE